MQGLENRRHKVWQVIFNLQYQKGLMEAEAKQEPAPSIRLREDEADALLILRIEGPAGNGIVFQVCNYLATKGLEILSFQFEADLLGLNWLFQVAIKSSTFWPFWANCGKSIRIFAAA